MFCEEASMIPAPAIADYKGKWLVDREQGGRYFFWLQWTTSRPNSAPHRAIKGSRYFLIIDVKLFQFLRYLVYSIAFEMCQILFQ